MSPEKSLVCVLVLILSVLSHPSYYNIFKHKQLPFRITDNSTYTILNEKIPILIEGSIANIEEMESLILNHNYIVEIQRNVFQNLPHLTWMEICFNEIKLIETNIFNGLTNLTHLDLRNNQISYIAPSAFDNMLNLEYIVLDDNKLKIWDSNWFVNTPSLTSIYVSRNLLEEIPDYAFGNISRSDYLFYIFFEENLITDIDDDALFGIENAEILSFAGNRIETFTGFFLRNITISSLYLNNNNIKCLEEEHFEEIFIANLIRIYDNPIYEYCLRNMQSWTEEHEKKLITAPYIG